MTLQQALNVAQPSGSSSEENLHCLAAFNKAVSEPLRLEVLRVLRNNSYGVMELSHILDVKQSALSHHLKILSQAGWVATRREGNSIFYRRQQSHQDKAFQAVQLSLFDAIDKLPLPEENEQRVQHIQSERAASSANFFRQHADNFEKQQELIATYSLYGDAVKELLETASLPASELAMEIGPGNGEFLLELSKYFKNVIALDNSAEMLEKAKDFSASHQLKNIEFVHQDTHTFAQQPVQVDCAVMNMVLHHTPAPASIFADLAKLVKQGGVLLLAELCPHDQSWATEACGDLWLGFEAEELLAWAAAAGFIPQQDVYHALRNGFQIQMHSFIKG